MREPVFSPGRSSHLFSQQVFQSSMLRRKKKGNSRNRKKRRILMLERCDRNVLNVNMLYKSGLIC